MEARREEANSVVPLPHLREKLGEGAARDAASAARR